MGYYNCQKGLVVTNSHLTASAKELARKNNICFWERENLIQKINSLKVNKTTVTRKESDDLKDKAIITNTKHFEFDIKIGAIIDYTEEEKSEVIVPSEINGVEVKKIGYSAFENKDLKKVKIPEGIVEIGIRAFKNNELTSVEIPDSVTQIGYWAFDDDVKLIGWRD